MKKEKDYIYEVQKEISLLGGILSLMGWDEKTHMPHNAVQERSQQMTILEKQIYDKLVSTRLNRALNKLKKRKQSNKDTLVINELSKQIKKIKKIPKEFIEEMTKATVMGGRTWEIAREKNKFRIFKPKLKALVELKQKEAKLLDPKKKPYDVLLDQFEEGMTSEKLTKTEVEKIKKSSTQFIRFMVEHIQRKRGRKVEKAKIRVKHGNRYGEVLLLGDIAFIIHDIDNEQKEISKANIKPDGSLATTEKSNLIELEKALSKVEFPPKVFIKEPIFEDLKRLFGKDVEVLVNF